MDGFRIRTREKKGDCLLKWGCPECNEEQSFILITRRASATFLGIKASTSEDLLDLRCKGCRYELRLQELDPVHHERLPSYI